MSTRKQLLTDTLFVGQIGGLVFYGMTQTTKMLTSVQGVSMSVFLLFFVFVLYLLVLSIKSHRAQPSRITKQIMLGHSVGILMVGLFSAVITKDLFDGTYEWALNDTVTMAVSVAGIVSVLTYGKWNGLRIDDPKMRGYLASCCKAIPQALMAWKILHVGGGGLSPWAIAIAHATTFMRLGQLQISLSEAKQEKNRIAMFIPEISNEVTWCFVTAAWLFWKFGG